MRRGVSGILLIAVTLAVAEATARLLLDPPGRYPPAQETPVIAEHATRGYGLRPGAAGHYTAGGYRAPIHINERGLRDTPLAEAVQADFRLLAVGDSFTMGLGVDSADSWPEQLERLLQEDRGSRSAVVNAGVPGYSARQMRQSVEGLLPELRPNVVLFGMNSETFWRVEAPYVLLAGQLVRSSMLPELTVGRNGLYYSPITRWQWLKRLDVWLNQHFELGAHLLAAARRIASAVRGASAPAATATQAPVDMVDVRQRLEPALQEIVRTAEIARDNGARLVVLLINPQSSDGSFAPVQQAYNHIVAAFCRERNIEVVDPLPTLTAQGGNRPVYRSSDDYHWTSAAHGVAARALAGQLAGSR